MQNSFFENQNSKRLSFSPFESRPLYTLNDNPTDLYDKTNELNETNAHLLQMKECKIILEKEIKEFPLSSFDYECRIQEL